MKKIKNIVKDKIFEKYGVDNVGKSPLIQERIINTRKQNYLKRINKFGFDTIEHHKACFALYYYLVKQYTIKQDLSCLENFNKPRTMSGVDGGYQLDHIISVKYGFENGILPNVIGDVSNLQMLPWKDNRTKWFKPNSDSIELLQSLGIT